MVHIVLDREDRCNRPDIESESTVNIPEDQSARMNKLHLSNKLPERFMCVYCTELDLLTSDDKTNSKSQHMRAP